jgi:hypothetical protein
VRERSFGELRLMVTDCLPHQVLLVPEVPTILKMGGCIYPGVAGGSKLLEYVHYPLMSLIAADCPLTNFPFEVRN